MDSKLLSLFLIIVIAASGCAGTGGRVTTTKATDIDQIPTTIGVYPLLTSEVKRQAGIVYRTTSTSVERNQIYIKPPAETKLVVNLQSQIMNDFLESELSYCGFSLKELPVETPDINSDSKEGKNTFVISLDLLRHLQEEYGLQAILVGNVYFMTDRYDPSNILVRAVFIKLIDVKTLDILCHVSFTDEDYGAEKEEVASILASELAILANLGRK